LRIAPSLPSDLVRRITEARPIPELVA
jgi:hypothetical protein